MTTFTVSVGRKKQSAKNPRKETEESPLTVCASLLTSVADPNDFCADPDPTWADPDLKKTDLLIDLNSKFFLLSYTFYSEFVCFLIQIVLFYFTFFKFRISFL